MNTVRAFLTIIANSNKHLHQFDVDIVFLHVDFHEEAHMTLPLGLTSTSTKFASWRNLNIVSSKPTGGGIPNSPNIEL